MYFDNTNNVGELVIIDGGQVARIKSINSDAGTAVVEVLGKGWGPSFEEQKVGYYNKRVDSPVVQYWRTNRHQFELVKYYGVYYDPDILFFKHGILVDPYEQTILDWDSIKDNKDYFCDGFVVYHKSKVTVCEHCGMPVMGKPFGLYFVQGDKLIKKKVCSNCFIYDLEITRRTYEESTFDENIDFIREEVEAHFNSSDSSMFITNNCNLTWFWENGHRTFFDKENHSEDIGRCEECCDWYRISSKKSVETDPIIERYFGTLNSNPCLCESCDSSRVSRKVESYYYKPDPIMIGEGRHYGVELELDDGKVGPACACVFKIDYKGIYPYYAKHDGSLGDNGMEIVSHPMTIDCHRESIGNLLEVTDHFGFYNSHRCGLHVHTSRSDWSNDVSDKVYTLLYRFRDSVFIFSEREDREDMDDWAGVNHVYFEKDGDVITVIADGCEDRYHALNCKNANTFEIRIFASTTSESRYVECIEWVDKLFEYADTHTLMECAEAHYVDVFGVDYGCVENEIHVEDISNRYQIWQFSNGQYLYVKKMDRYNGVFKHYHVVGFHNSCNVKLPLSGRVVGYQHSYQNIGISDSNVRECHEAMSETEMWNHNRVVLELLNREVE